MRNKKLQIGIKEIMKVSMTADEKKHIFESVTGSSLVSSVAIKNTWTIYSFMSQIYKNRLVYYGVISFFIVLASGGVVFASQDSLPDSIFYPIKVDVFEPIVSALTFSPENKAKYESSLSTARLVEAETLAHKGKLNPSNEKRLNSLLTNHTLALNNALDKINKTKSSEKIDDIVTSYNAEMNAHAQVLDIVSARKGNKNESNNDNQISKTARINASKVIDNLKSKENNVSDKYKNKKQNVEAIINSTVTDLSNTKTETSPEKQTVVSGANETLDNAKQFMSAADKNEQEGNSKDAYLNLINSETSAKEAKIFLKAGLKFNEINNTKKD